MNGKLAALTGLGADSDGLVESLANLTDQVETETARLLVQATIEARVALVEDFGKVLCLNTTAGISNGQRLIFSLIADGDRLSFGVLEGIVKELLDHDLGPIDIG